MVWCWGGGGGRILGNGEVNGGHSFTLTTTSSSVLTANVIDDKLASDCGKRQLHNDESCRPAPMIMFRNKSSIKFNTSQC